MQRLVLDDFEDRLTERGRAYWRAGQVIHCVEDTLYGWTAQVRGGATYPYRVNLALVEYDDEVLVADTDCSCPMGGIASTWWPLPWRPTTSSTGLSRTLRRHHL